MECIFSSAEEICVVSKQYEFNEIVWVRVIFNVNQEKKRSQYGAPCYTSGKGPYR